MLKKALVFMAVFCLAASALHAGPLADAFRGLGDRLMGVARDVVGYGGPAMTLLGGGRAAWKAAHKEAFTTPLIAAIAGVALFVGVGSASSAVGTGFRGVSLAQGGLNLLVAQAGIVLGGLVTLISGSMVGWRMAHKEPFTTELVLAIVAASIAAVSVAAVR